MKNNIYLIGMMGSGKSTIGGILADNIYYDFVDADDFIVKHSKYESINEIFEKENEPFFRKLENEAMRDLSDFQNSVIATGGGVVLKDENIEMMQSTGLVIYLQSTIENLISRLKNADDRPLLKAVDLEEKLKTLLSERKDLYNKAADITIDISSKEKKVIVDEIIEVLEGDYNEYISD